MPFAPEHDYEAYNAAIEKRLKSRAEPSVGEKFQKYADYYDVLMQARRQIAGNFAEDRLQQKLAKFQRHAQLVQIYKTLDRVRNGK